MRQVSFLKAITLLCLILALSTCVSAEADYSKGVTLDDEQTDSVQKKADEIMSALDISEILNFVSRSFSQSSAGLFRSFGCVMAVIFISAVFAILRDSFGTSGSIFDFVSMLFLILFTLIPVGNCIDEITKSVSKLCTYMMAFIPSMTAIYIAGGSTVTAAGSSVTCSCAITALQLAGTNLIIPCAKISTALTAVNTISSKAELSGVSNFLKTVCLWITGLLLTLFSGILSIQTLISGSADNLAMRGVRFTAAKLIPIAGGMISESLKTVLSGVSFVRSVAGGAGIVFILYTALPPILSVLALKAFCILSSVCSKLIGLSRQASYLDGLNNALNLLLAIILCCACAFIVMLAIFIKTAISL